MPFLSYVICAYNEPLRLAMCLESLRRQLFTDFEVVVTDDGSSDPRVAEVADAYQVKWVTREHDYRGEVPTRNMPAVLNAGVGLAEGAVVQTLQQDHILAPDFGLWLARAWEDKRVVFGLTARWDGEITVEDLDGMLRTVHLPDGEARWKDYFAEGRNALIEFRDWRHTDGLDAAVLREYWVDVDVNYVGSGQMWLDHMLDLQLRGLRFTVNPFMRLWHWEHPGRDTGEWQKEMRESDKYFKKKRGKTIWVADVQSLLSDYRERVRKMREAFGANG